MAQNPGTNGTVYDYVNNLLTFQQLATELIQDLQFRLEVVENFQPDPPKNCKDIADQFAHVPLLRSQLYDIFPSTSAE